MIKTIFEVTKTLFLTELITKFNLDNLNFLIINQSIEHISFVVKPMPK